MKKALLVGMVLVVVAAVLLWGADESLADCQGEDCWTCAAYKCFALPISNYCACESGGSVGGGRYCIAGGGSCVIVL